MEIRQILYFSSQTTPLKHSEILKLLDTAITRNNRLNITGLLLYLDGSFCQVIEGKYENVGRVFDIILKDARHKNILILQDQLEISRSFPEWSMAFENIKSNLNTHQEIENVRHEIMEKFGLIYANDLIPIMLNAFINKANFQTHESMAC